MKSSVKAIVAICVLLNFILMMSMLLMSGTDPVSLTRPASAMSATDEAALVTQQVDNWQLTSDEKRFSEIGWIPNIEEGLKKSAELDRPIFMLCVVGDVLNGRC